MFTGLVQQMGRLSRVEMSSGSGRLVVEACLEGPPCVRGESIAVQGVCLTLVEFNDSHLQFDVLRETFERSGLGRRKIGQRLNIERALRLGDPLGGHIVTGHIDGVGQVKNVRRIARDRVLEISCGEELLKDMVPKGSVACDGVSLTIADLKDDVFTVHIIPHTWESTAFSELTTGAEVNVETDVLGKYSRRVMEGKSQQGGVTWDALKKAGFVS